MSQRRKAYEQSISGRQIVRVIVLLSWMETHTVITNLFPITNWNSEYGCGSFCECPRKIQELVR